MNCTLNSKDGPLLIYKLNLVNIFSLLNASKRIDKLTITYVPQQDIQFFVVLLNADDTKKV